MRNSHEAAHRHTHLQQLPAGAPPHHGNSFTIKERKPFLCDCAADESQKPASIDRYGNRLTMIINHPHHCPAYQGTTQN